MDAALIHFIILGIISGLTEGDGVLPDGPLNAAVGETVMFTTTLTPTETSFFSVAWTFNGTENIHSSFQVLPLIQVRVAGVGAEAYPKLGSKNIITSNSVDIIGPVYEGRTTLLTSTGSLELRNVGLNDTGDYTVSIVPGGDGRTRLQIYEPVSNITITISSRDLVEFNSSVTLSCSSSGSSTSFLWTNGSSELTASERVQLSDGGSSLTIINVSRCDQGVQCHVSNPVSDGTSDPVNLNISYGPENIDLILSSSQEYLAVGSDISLNCSVGSGPPAQFKWFLNGDQLPDTGSELRLMNIQMNHSGNYSCEAFNSKTLRSHTSQPSAITVLGQSSGCAARIAGVAGIVIACWVFVAGAIGGGYYIYKKKFHKNPQKQNTGKVFQDKEGNSEESNNQDTENSSSFTEAPG